jgi:hypothetical protein
VRVFLYSPHKNHTSPTTQKDQNNNKTKTNSYKKTKHQRSLSLLFQIFLSIRSIT